MRLGRLAAALLLLTATAAAAAALQSTADHYSTSLVTPSGFWHYAVLAEDGGSTEVCGQCAACCPQLVPPPFLC